MPHAIEELLQQKKYEYIVTIDGGGTKTKIEVFDREGKQLNIQTKDDNKQSIIADGSNVSTNTIPMVQTLFTQVLSNNYLNYPQEPLINIMSKSLVVAGIAGIGNEDSRNGVLKIFTDLGTSVENIMLTNDAAAALEHAGQPGMAVIAGTGSICIGTLDGKTTYRAGGNGGAMFNDPGSAYYLGSLALQYAINADQSGPQDTPKSAFYCAIRELSKKFLGENKRPYISDKKIKMTALKSPLNQHKLNRELVAELASIVFEYAYQHKNPKAKEMVTIAAAVLAENIIKVFKEMRTLSDINITLIGGVFTSPYAETFINEIRDQVFKHIPNERVNFINASKLNLISENVKSAIKNKKTIEKKTFPNKKEVDNYQFSLEKLPGEKLETLIKAAETLDSYLKAVLTTEKSHPETNKLAEQAQSDETLTEAVTACANVDVAALSKLEQDYLNSDKFLELVTAIEATIKNGGRIYIAGCGSSGRLATFLEKFCREKFPAKYRDEQGNEMDTVVAVMAGGDVAIVSAVEKFEDKGEYSAKQLKKQGFNAEKDLYIGVSASGSATYNNEAIRMLAEKIRQDKKDGKPNKDYLRPWLVCCNSEQELYEVQEKEYQLAKKLDSNVKAPHPIVEYVEEMRCLGLNVGPNALSGSTRMQSATVSEIAIYYAIRQAFDRLDPTSDAVSIEANKAARQEQMKLLISKLQQASLTTNLSKLITAESACYKSGRYMMYSCDAKYAITVFTDLTERSPTFRLPKIENEQFKQDIFAPCSISIKNTKTKEAAFTSMLGRKAYGLDWDGQNDTPDEPKTKTSVITGFDFSEGNKADREQLTGKQHDSLDIAFSEDGKQLILSYLPVDSNLSQPESVKFDIEGLDEFSRQIFLKMILNTHSTLVMGRMGRYKGNFMTYVDISNAKLFSRAVRLITEEICRRLQNLSIISQQLKVPDIGITYSSQAISLIVSDLFMQEKDKKAAIILQKGKQQVNVEAAQKQASIFDQGQVESIVEKAADIYLQQLNGMEKKSSDVSNKNKQKALSQSGSFQKPQKTLAMLDDESKEAKQYIQENGMDASISELKKSALLKQETDSFGARIVDPKLFEQRKKYLTNFFEVRSRTSCSVTLETIKANQFVRCG